MTQMDLGPKIDGDDQAVLRAALALEPDGWALEFGTGGGGTARLIADSMPLLTFDSFEGLPEDWRPAEGYVRGSFWQEKIPTIEGATVVVGLYEDTLPSFDWPDQVGLIHLDADLYSSTTCVLLHAGHLIQPGVIVVMDELFGYPGAEEHEERAWLEFAGRVGLVWEPIGHGREQFALRVTARLL